MIYKKMKYIYNIMDDITRMIERELELKSQLKELKKDMNEMIEETDLYKSVFEASLEVPNVEVSEKVARSHAIKVVYDSCKPQE